MYFFYSVFVSKFSHLPYPNLCSYITHVDWDADGQLIQLNSGAGERLFFEAPRGLRVTPTSAVLANILWATWTSVLGPSVQGIWQGTSDVTDVNSADLSHDGQVLATGDDFGLVKLFPFPVPTAARSKRYLGHSSHVTCVRWSHNDQLLASVGGADTALAIWARVGGRSDAGAALLTATTPKAAVTSRFVPETAAALGGARDSDDSDTDDGEDGYDSEVAGEVATDYAKLAYTSNQREATAPPVPPLQKLQPAASRKPAVSRQAPPAAPVQHTRTSAKPSKLRRALSLKGLLVHLMWFCSVRAPAASHLWLPGL